MIIEKEFNDIMDFLKEIKTLLKSDIEDIRKEFRGMDSKLWVDTKKHDRNIERLFNLIGFSDDGITRYNGILSKIEKLESKIDNISDNSIKDLSKNIADNKEKLIKIFSYGIAVSGLITFLSTILTIGKYIK